MQMQGSGNALLPLMIAESERTSRCSHQRDRSSSQPKLLIPGSSELQLRKHITQALPSGKPLRVSSTQVSIINVTTKVMKS